MITKKITLAAEDEGQALKIASEQIGIDETLIDIKMVKDGKKGLFGKFKEMPEFEACYKQDKNVDINEKTFENEDNLQDEEYIVKYYRVEDIYDDNIKRKVNRALDYLTNILDAFNIGKIDKTIEVDNKNNLKINLSGDNIAVVVGRFGDVLDAIQHLVSLSSNQFGGSYMRVTLDSGDFRKRRQKTLHDLGKSIARKALRQGRSVALEPMNPYERHIIHEAVTDIDGVYSKSVGNEPYRKIVVYPEKPNDNKGYKLKSNKRRYDKDYMSDKSVSNEPSTYDFEKEFLKSNSEKSSDYGKIDLN